MRAIIVETGRPVTRREVIDRLFRERLDALADPLDPGFGFDLVRLSASRTEIVVQEQRDLDAHVHDNDELAALIDRIAARIGGKRVVVHLPQDTHIPERAVLAAPAQHHLAAAMQAEWPARAEGEPPLRPLRLFDTAGTDQGAVRDRARRPAASFHLAARHHAVVRVEGPERIAMEWWRQDGKELTRDYFRIEDAEGLRFWIFRDGLYEGEVSTTRQARSRRTGSCTDSSHDHRPAYAEIGITTNFSFLRGGSDPQDYVHQASELGLPAIGIADHNTLAGVVRAYNELDNAEVHAQAEAPDRRAHRLHRRHARYFGLSARSRRLWPAVPASHPGQAGDDTAVEKGECHLDFADLLEFSEGQLLVLTLPHRFEPAQALDILEKLKAQPRRGVWLAASLVYRGDDRRRLARLADLAAKARCRCSRPTRCCIIIPRAVRFRTC